MYTVMVGCERHMRYAVIVRKGRSRSSKVTDFGSNPQCVCDFVVLVININLGPIFHRFKETWISRSIVATFIGSFSLKVFDRSESKVAILSAVLTRCKTSRQTGFTV